MKKYSKRYYIISTVIGLILFALYVQFKSAYIWLIPALALIFLLFISGFLLCLAGVAILLLILVYWISRCVRPSDKDKASPIPMFSIEEMLNPGKYEHVQRPKYRPFVAVINCFVLIVACFCFMNFLVMIACKAFAGGEKQLVSSVVRFPLADSGSVVVDSENRIYCWTRRYQRLQVYDKNGQFLRGWFLDSASTGGPAMLVDPNNVLHVEQFGDKYITFDSNGNLLDRGSKSWPEHDRLYMHEDSEKNRYIYREKYHDIIKTGDSEIETVLVSDPLHLKFVSALFPTMIALFIVLFIVFGYKAYRRREK